MTLLTTAKSETNFSSRPCKQKQNKPSLPYDIFSCSEIWDKHILKACLTSISFFIFSFLQVKIIFWEIYQHSLPFFSIN